MRCRPRRGQPGGELSKPQNSKRAICFCAFPAIVCVARISSTRAAYWLFAASPMFSAGRRYRAIRTTFTLCADFQEKQFIPSALQKENHCTSIWYRAHDSAFLFEAFVIAIQRLRASHCPASNTFPNTPRAVLRVSCRERRTRRARIAIDVCSWSSFSCAQIKKPPRTRLRIRSGLGDMVIPVLAVF